MSLVTQKLMDIYERLYAHFGPRHWWPGDSRFEIMVGAVLTQNTAWKNVEKAIANLKRPGLLHFDALYRLPVNELAERIRPAGYFNVKAKRLRHLLETIATQSNGDLDAFLSVSLHTLRERLLGTHGVGPETADSIILYAAEKPIFVVDTYTKRLLLRHGLVSDEADYHEIQDLFMSHLPHEVPLFNEYHALIVATGNTYCKPSTPLCEKCPLNVLFEK